MRVYLLRHGIAENAGPGVTDAQRGLTGEGRDKLDLVIRAADDAGVRPDLVLSSPLVRAVQTGEMVREELGVKTPLQLTDKLLPHGTPQGVWKELSGLRNLDEVLLAGHEPLLSQLAAYLLAAPTLQVRMRKAGMISIDIESFRGEPHGILQWMVIPKLMD